MIQLFIAMAAFVGGHVVISGGGLRQSLVATLGERGFAGIFSILAVATLVWSIFAVLAAPGIVLWWAGDALRWLNVLLVALGIVLVVAGTTTRGPAMTGYRGCRRTPR